MAKKLISIISPAYNEQDNILLMVAKVEKVMQTLAHLYDYEYIIVDDGSQDGTWEKICEAAQENPRIKGVCLTRNFGQQIAISAGIDQAQGDALIYLDSDLQHPPELIPSLIRKWQEGAQVVHTIRSQTKKEPLVKKVMSKFFYQMVRFLSDLPPAPGMADFKLLDRRVYKQLKSMRERNRFLRGMVPWLGYKAATVAFEAKERQTGVSAYNFRRNLTLARMGVLSMSTRPLKYVGYLGAVLTTLSFLGLLMSAAIMIYKSDFRYISPTVMLALFNTFLIGIVLACLGVVALYISYLREEVIQRPLYVVREKVGLENRERRAEGGYSKAED